jgi:hypothetical protein
MNEETRDWLRERLTDDLVDTILADRKFRYQFCRERFAAMDDDDLLQAASDAGIEPIEFGKETDD